MTTSLSVIRTKYRIIISRLSRSITIGWGDMEGRSRTYLRLDYMPSAILFVDHSDQDAFNQYIHLEGGFHSGRLTVSLSEDIAILESANLNSFYDTTGTVGKHRRKRPYTGQHLLHALEGKLPTDRENVSARRD
jgi:hypothetical protein